MKKKRIKDKKKLEKKAIFIKDWEELSKINNESDKYILKVDIHRCNDWLEPKDKSKDFHYLSTHIFYGNTYEYSTKLLRKCGFNVTINNWDNGKKENNKYQY